MTARIYRDAYGIPHLRATDALALARAQGAVTARDRAWQIEVERHRTLGTSAAFLGEEHVHWDALVRRAGLADTARRCFESLSPDTKAWVDAYTEGVNSALPEARRLAPEFARTELAAAAWEPWTPLALWLSHHLLFAGFPSKLWRDRVIEVLGADAVRGFASDGPGSSGSNGWLLGPERTTSGFPLLGGDPHRFIEAPGVYQQIRLSCPEFDVLGLAVPGVPGIAHFAHAGSVAWAITNSMADYQDLYRERLRRTPGAGAGVEAWGPDGWEQARSGTETIEVARREPVVVETVETARGPVVIGGVPAQEEPGDAGDPGARGRWTAVSLRWPARVRGSLGFDALPALLRSRSVADVDRALDHWVEPVNVVMAADTSGGLLHRVAGAVPVRAAANRVRVVDAWDEAAAWTGAWEPMPRAGLGEGRAVMANARGLASPLGVEFAAPHRARRIAALLDSRPRWSAGEMAAVHTDTLLAPASVLLERLVLPLTGLSPAANALREELVSWDRRMAADSRGAAVFAAWRGALTRRLTADPALAGLTPRADDPPVFLPWLSPLGRVGHALEGLTAPGVLPGSVDIATHTREALEEVAAAGVAATWGDTHRLAPWEAVPSQDTEWPAVHGDHDCVMSSSSVPGLTDLSARASAARYVWDLADRDNSGWVVPLGASGRPSSPHHHDQLGLWVRGELAPVVTDWQLLTEEVPVTVRERPAPDVPAPRPGGAAPPVLHTCEVPGIGSFAVRALDPGEDAAVVHSWVDSDRARYWGMVGRTVEQVREVYAYVDGLETHHAYLLEHQGRPVGLLQTYEPEHDPLGEHYSVRPGDVGMHLLFAPSEGAPRKGFGGALLTAMLDFVWADPACLRVVAEPDVRNEKSHRRLARGGFTAGQEVRLEHKTARLFFLARDTGAPRTG
ncbi:penicillin amidase [Streptomyces sp. WZ.A104]|uniref:GNAT family N-acetyltransferase n=1 Tax=Streptomyces sp. WZ.A104 TaxID=2023771 RepID=UPI000BBB73BB|nr:GNAT family N-acetyltransferase [Streptomyces sp. WZ.A104]PCG84202.1 penicillin amidase [Streptomyces sp. WZ.A104]